VGTCGASRILEQIEMMGRHNTGGNAGTKDGPDRRDERSCLPCHRRALGARPREFLAPERARVLRAPRGRPARKPADEHIAVRLPPYASKGVYGFPNLSAAWGDARPLGEPWRRLTPQTSPRADHWPSTFGQGHV
jgi:hypothetical protein